MSLQIGTISVDTGPIGLYRNFIFFFSQNIVNFGICCRVFLPMLLGGGLNFLIE